MSQFESIDRVLKKGRLELQEVKKKNPPPNGDGSGEPVRTNTNRNPNETIFGDNKNKKKKYLNQYERPTGETPPKTETPKNEKPLTKHQKARQEIIQKRTQYGLKPDSRGVYKPTKSGLKSSLANQIKYSSTPPKASAKKTPAQIKKFNQQVRKSEKYSGNENQKRVKKLVDRAYKNQKIDKSKAGLVQRMKDVAYGKNPYKKKFGSTGLNIQKKYDKQMLEIGGRLSKLQTPKQLQKLKAKIASKPAEKTMTYLAPAGSGKPVPLKIPRKKKIIVPPETKPVKTFNGQSFDDFIKKANRKVYQKGNLYTPPVTDLEKIKPRITTSKNLCKISQTKLGSKIPSMQLSKRLMKHKNKYAVGAGLALAGGAYLLGRNRVNKAKEKEKKALVIANTKKSQKPKELVSVNLFLNKTGTPPGQTKTSSPSYAKPTQKSSNVNRNKFLP